MRALVCIAVACALPAFAAPAKRSCPSVNSLSKPWVEHVGPVQEKILAAHFKAEVDDARVMLLSIDTIYWWVGSVRRGRGEEESIQDPGCFVLGTAAFYVNGPERDPMVDFIKVIGEGNESALAAMLMELRWYDPKDGRKHRWYNTALADRLGWSVDGRGQPSGNTRPIPPPQSTTELDG